MSARYECMLMALAGGCPDHGGPILLPYRWRKGEAWYLCHEAMHTFPVTHPSMAHATGTAIEHAAAVPA